MGTQCAFNKDRPKSAWLDATPTCESHARGLRYYNKLWNAQPPWADVRAIRRIYAEARLRRRNGEQVEVDHIMPLSGPNFCGLHVHWNLHIVPSATNRAHSNTSFPGHPQLDLFANSHADIYFELEKQ